MLFFQTPFVALGLLASALPLVFAGPSNQITYNQTTCYDPFEQFTRRFSATDFGPRDFPCYAFVENENIAGSKLSVYHFDNFTENPTPWFQLIEETARRAIPFYAELLGPEKSLNIRIHLRELQTTKGYDEYRGSTLTRDADSSEHCYIEVYSKDYGFNPGWWRDDYVRKASTREGFQNALAHELYHCVQIRSGFYQNPASERTKETARWWYEGSADFFASSLYPMRPEDRHQVPFGSERSWTLCGIIFFGNAEGNRKSSFFFLYLSNMGWSNLEIHEWVISQQYREDGLEEFKRLATETRFIELWSDFATKFIDGNIFYNDSTSILANKAPKDKWNLSRWSALDSDIDSVGFHLEFIAAYPFEIQTLQRVQLLPGQVLLVTPEVYQSESADLTLWWKRDGDPTWQTISLGQTIELRGAELGSSNNTTSYNFLPTTTNMTGTPWFDFYQRANLRFTRPRSSLVIGNETS